MLKLDLINIKNFTVIVCTVLTVISGILFYLIGSKVSTATEPFEKRLVLAETKMNNHIINAEKKLNGFSSQVFNITIAGIEKSIRSVEKSQEKIDKKQDRLSDKIDTLSTLIIEKINEHRCRTD